MANYRLSIHRHSNSLMEQTFFFAFTRISLSPVFMQILSGMEKTAMLNAIILNYRSVIYGSTHTLIHDSHVLMQTHTHAASPPTSLGLSVCLSY